MKPESPRFCIPFQARRSKTTELVFELFLALIAVNRIVKAKLLNPFGNVVN